MALGGQNGLFLADWSGSRKMVKLPGHKNNVTAVVFSRDGRLLASAGVEDRTLKIWELSGFDPSIQPAPPSVHSLSAPSYLCDLAFSPDGKRLIGISRDVVKVWDVRTHQEVITLRGAATSLGSHLQSARDL